MWRRILASTCLLLRRNSSSSAAASLQAWRPVGRQSRHQSHWSCPCCGVMTTDVGSFKSYQLNEGRTTPVPVRVSPTEKIRGEIDALFDGSRELSEVIEEVARLGARLIIQIAVEAEVEVFLGRARYERTSQCPDARVGSRNGYCESTIKTTAGPVTVARPKLRGTTEEIGRAHV